MASQPIDYAALAEQARQGGQQQGGGIDYAALADQARGKPAADPLPALPKPVSVPMTNYPIDPKTGKRSTQPQVMTPQGMETPLSLPARAAMAIPGQFAGSAEQLGRGLHTVTHPQSGSDFAGGLSDTLRGGLGVALPFMLPGIAAHPFRAAAGVIFGGGAQQATEKSLQAVGVPEGYSKVAGDVAGGLVGGAASQGDRIAAAGAKKLLPTVKSTLNPVEQKAVDYARGEGNIRLSPGTITGNKGVQNLEAVTQASPLGAQTGAEFRRGTEADLQGAAGRLSDQVHPQPATPESVGRAIPAKMDQRIQELSQPRDEAYKQAWQGRDDPEHTYHVPVRMKEVPVVDAEGKPTGDTEQQPVMKQVNMPVDIRDLKEQAEPIYDSMKWRLAPAEQNASAGFNALEKILKSDDFIPAWQAEDGLSALKSMARMEPGEGVRDRSQGIGAHLIPELQQRIDDAVANTGEDAIAGLQKGRQLHSQIMDVEDVATKLRDKEPVRNFGRLVSPKDTQIDLLRKVQELAPEQMEPTGRAWVQQQMDRATREGGFSKTQGLLNDWRDMGPQTKAILFPDPKLRESLDNFFKVADMTSHAPNPSGTALVSSATSINPVRMAAGYLGSKLFFTPKGIDLLTDAVKAPNPGAAALKFAKIKASGPPPEEPPPAGPGPEAPPPGAPPSAAGPAPQPPEPGAAGKEALNGAIQRNAAGVTASKAKLQPASRTGGKIVGPQASNDAIVPTENYDEIQQGTTGARAAVSEPVRTGPQTEGAETQVTVPGSARQYKARYKVVELDDLQTSHNGQTFQPNPKYQYANDRDYTKPENQGKVVTGALPDTFDPRYLLTDNPDSSNGPPVTDQGNALGGNGRGMIMQRVYASNPKGVKSYRSLLELKAQQFGLDPDQVRGMKKPVLVREIDPAEFQKGGQQDAVTDFNKVGTANLRGSEKALADSRRVSQGTLDDLAGRLEAKGTDSTLADVLEGKSGTEVLGRLIQDGVISPQERAAYAEGNTLTADGKTRIQKLMLGRFFRDPAQLDRTAPAVRQKLERMAAPLAQVEGKPGWSLADHMHQALDLLEDARGHNSNIDDLVSQSGLFAKQEFSPEAVTLAKQLQGSTQTELTRRVRQYAEDAQYATGGGGGMLFGEPPTPAASFDEAFGKPAKKK